MRKLLVIGIGAGNPEHVTIQAIRAMNTVDVFFVIDKEARGSGAATAELSALRREICERYVEGSDHRFVEISDPQRDRVPDDYAQEVAAWHAARAQLFARAVSDELGDDDVGAFLVWGDPSLYDSTLRIVEQMVRVVPFEYEVIPGITSIQALAASHRTVLHGIGEAVHVTTGRLLAGGLADDVRNAVVMLDANNSFETLDPDAFDIHWGAYLGTPGEVVIAGPLTEVADRIVRTRAALRDEHGWIMDIYLLRRRSSAAL